MKPWIGVAAMALAAGTIAWRANAQHATTGPGAGVAVPELITHFLPGEGQPTQLTVIDPARRVIGVYHIARDSGEIQLKSVRTFSWDLSMDEFNGVEPLPQQIRNTLQRTP